MAPQYADNQSNDDAGEADSKVRHELEHRMGIWRLLLASGGPRGTSPKKLRELGIYGGAQGVWVDKARTSDLTANGTGVTVGLLHTGTSYADDLSDDGLLYHYPATNRPKARDLSEINATKAAGRLGLPIFVIAYPSPTSSKRDVHLGWIEDWDDSLELFLITFGDFPLQTITELEEESFELVDKGKVVRREVGTRLGQQRFKFHVFKRYGRQCAVCSISVPELLDAAHIRPKKKHGSDDPRNGLVLCAVHHRALDAGLFAIEPNSLKVHCRASGPDANALRIDHPTLGHLSNKPHRHALEWLWNRWQNNAD